MGKMKTVYAFLVLSLMVLGNHAKPPNILLIVADDLGFNDVSWHNRDILTPNMDSLVRGGIALEHNYVQPICTPTRSALMTGYYPIHTGRQYSVLWFQEPTGLYTNFTLMPEYLQKLGYRTHIVGKWHLGYCNETYLPTRRGFESHNGFWGGGEDYYSHKVFATVGGGKPGYDFRSNDDPDEDARGKYSSYIFADHASSLIKEHAANSSDQPLFLYLPFQDTHSPLQAPKKFIDMYPHVKNKARRTFSAMATAMDSAIGQVVAALKESGLYNDTLIVFTGDNGGQIFSGGNNWPLRGNKGTLWEGGTRVPGFVHAPFLKHTGINYTGLIHVTDWLPTLYAAAGGDLADLPEGIDGVNQWPSLANARVPSKSNRQEFLYNIAPDNPPVCFHRVCRYGAALRVGEMKLMVGNPESPIGWIEPDRVVDSAEDSDQTREAIAELMSEESHLCGEEVTFFEDQQVRLYNLTADPSEKHNIADGNQGLVAELRKRLRRHEETMIPPNVHAEVAEGNPNRHGGFFATGWCKALPEAEGNSEPVPILHPATEVTVQLTP